MNSFKPGSTPLLRPGGPLCQDVGATSLRVLREVSSHTCGPGHRLQPSLLRQDLEAIWGSQFQARPSCGSHWLCKEKTGKVLLPSVILICNMDIVPT